MTAPSFGHVLAWAGAASLTAACSGCRRPTEATDLALPGTQQPMTTGATGDTGATPPWSKDSWPDWAIHYEIPPLSPLLLVPPSIRIVGFERAWFATGARIVPAFGPDPGVIFAGNSGALNVGFEIPNAFVLSGALPRGQYTLYDAWDGVSGCEGTCTEEMVGVAGDVNGDGHLDAWVSTNLVLGPLLGKVFRYWDTHDGDGAIAWVDQGGDSPQSYFWYEVMNGGFDADGDGALDALFAASTTGYLAYGPFEGRIALPWAEGADLDRWTIFGQQWCDSSPDAPTLLKNHLGPGHDAFAIGQCYDSTSARIYDLAGERGRRVPIHDQVSHIGDGSGWATPVRDPGDVDLDGFGDLYLQDGDWLSVVAGPTSGQAERGRGLMRLPDGDDAILKDAVGDMNGDGVPEFLGYRQSADETILFFSPHSDPVDTSDALVLASHWFDVQVPPLDGVDIDGDGLADLIDHYYPNPPEERGELRIWLGPDLVAAHEAQRAAARARTRAADAHATPSPRSTP